MTYPTIHVIGKGNYHKMMVVLLVISIWVNSFDQEGTSFSGVHSPETNSEFTPED